MRTTIHTTWATALLVATLLLPACRTPTTSPEPFIGTWRFPSEADLHFPVLVISEDGRFGFCDQPDISTSGNHGTWTRHQNNLTLTYADTECCRHVGIDQESLILNTTATNRLTVLFRDTQMVLTPVAPEPAH